MALKDKIEAAKNGQAGGAPGAAPAAAPTPGAGGKGVNSKTEAFKAKGAALRAQMSDDQKATEGSKSDKVAFVCALGDPSRKQARVENKTSVPSYVVVGYKFRALEDMTVPHAPLKQGMRTILDVEEATEKQIPAGQEFHLNIVETAMLISRVEYAGRFSGEGVQVALSVKTSNDREEPLPILNKVGAGSIKENMELIADMVGGDGTEKNRGTAQVKDEYAETFGALYTRRSLQKKSAGATKKAGEGQADIAAAFRAYYGKQ